MDVVMQEKYLSGLLRMRNKGTRILFNGKELPYEFWYRLFHKSGNGGFYKMDYCNKDFKEINFKWIGVQN
ncbi:hypothetical protein BXO88_08075 [Oribacterium sp. C9]|uniref:hypothetical protein n=1 Tax=Oribacterium sp. C9 TaxID=1943579 RepID=UPI00098FB508|nr:hypothetical protein [Oribacterium sp. C9]OON86461.1 hypothetical protein BXO88_08075 [Oribacterium sp. C9]